jgi:hypothetical protein
MSEFDDVSRQLDDLLRTIRVQARNAQAKSDAEWALAWSGGVGVATFGYAGFWSAFGQFSESFIGLIVAFWCYREIRMRYHARRARRSTP